MKIETLPRPAHAGREQSCQQCGITYHARRANSRFCSHRCVKRAQRGAEPTKPQAASGLKAWLLKRGYAASTGPNGYALTVTLRFLASELEAADARIRALGLRSLAPANEAALKAKLRDLGIRA